MANPNIGTCPCPICKAPAHVRKMSKGQGLLYLSCADCGHITPRLGKGQTYILDNATLYGPEGPPITTTADARSQEAPSVAAAPPAKPAKRPFLDFY